MYFSKSEEIDEGASGWFTYRIKDAEAESVKEVSGIKIAMEMCRIPTLMLFLK